MVALISKISERKQTEQEETVLRHGKPSRQSFNGKTILDLAGEIAHDFNNLLYPIIGYTEMTINDMPEDSPCKNNLMEVLRAAGRAQDMIQHFLTFNSNGESKPKPVRVQLILQEVINLLKISKPETIEIIENIGENCGMVLADPIQVHRVMMNLCTNACHAMQQTGGNLSVALTEKKLGSETAVSMDVEPGLYICLTVSDTGHGIAPSIINRIFDPFFTTKKQKNGTGLGLFVVFGIVRGYGGNISISSTLNKGTDVDVYLPLMSTEDQTWRQIEKVDSNERGMTANEVVEIQSSAAINMLT